MNLSNLAAFASAVPGGYQDAQKRQQALALQALQLQDQQRQKNALALMLSGIGGAQGQAADTGTPYTGPLAGGAAPTAGGPAPSPAVSGAGAPAAASSPVAGGAPAPAAPAAGPAPSAGGPAPTGFQMPPSMMQQLGAMKQRIMAANPGADPATVMEALQLGASLLAKDNSTETRLMVAQLQQNGQLNRAMLQIQGRLEAVDRQQAGASARTAEQQAGATDRAQMRVGAQQALLQSRQNWQQARDVYLQKFGTMKETQRAKLRGALQKWQGAQHVMTTDLTAGAPPEKITKDQQAVDAAEAEYNELTLGEAPAAAPPAAGGGGAAATPGDAAAASPPAGGGGAVTVPMLKAAPAPPAVGTVQDGYRFKGGDPADPKSWEKVP